MTTFNVKSLLAWETVQPNEVLEFEVFSGTRELSLFVVTTNRVDVFASYEEDMSNAKLVASADGQFSFGLTTAIPVYLQFRALDDTDISIKGPTANHIVPKVDEPTFTAPIPHGRRNSDLDRIMRMVKVNEARRDAMLENTLSDLKAAQQERIHAVLTEQKEKEDAKKLADLEAAKKLIEEAESANIEEDTDGKA